MTANVSSPLLDPGAAWTALPGPALQLGESPFWHPLEQRWYCVDIAGRALVRWCPGEADVERWAMPSEPGCIAPARSNGVAVGLVVALRDRICHAPQWGGGLRELAALPFDAATQRANDGKCDASGRFWVGTVHEPASGPRESVAGLYCVDLRGGVLVRRVLEGVATANGLAWSPDGQCMYWADTPAHVIRRWRCDAHGDPVGVPSVFQQFDFKPDGWQPGMAGYAGRPDGAAVDAHGNYWCAMYEGARILCFAPTGQQLGQWDIPVQCPTMVCLGAVEGVTQLLVTSASRGRPAEELARMPLSGRVLHTAAQVQALPVHWCELDARHVTAP
ncbi:SMP-30/gluconolactonase/LRE family protein [Diaphorobacter sp.]|uniref:SMP-30/gluconolactonase/LRE family protein n=1 Tax=Diaphorobacter sp. TaxID=1934310 RepID=UPI0028A79F56|nr:SMP-30/gluconolactonase/LRE family protein [Diaphorobacter sp.]